MVRCTFCQVDNDLEPEPLPAPPPARAPYGFAPMSAPDARTSGSVAMVAVLGVGVALLVVGGAFAMLTTRRASSVSLGPVVTAAPYAPLAPPMHTTSAVTDNFFADAHAVPLAFKAKIGASPMATRLVLYQTYAIAELQDPQRADNIDRYTYRAGSVDSPQPEHFAGTAKELSARVFAIESIDYALVPRLCAESLTRLAIDGGKISHIIIEKEHGGAAVILRVYVSTERRGGYVEYDTKGKMKREAK